VRPDTIDTIDLHLLPRGLSETTEGEEQQAGQGRQEQHGLLEGGGQLARREMLFVPIIFYYDADHVSNM
jgi:hypothetical protein